MDYDDKSIAILYTSIQVGTYICIIIYARLYLIVHLHQNLSITYVIGIFLI